MSEAHDNTPSREPFTTEAGRESTRQPAFWCAPGGGKTIAAAELMLRMFREQQEVRS